LILCEIAIAACDLAEVLGAAIGLNLLFHIPLTTGVLLTALDTFLVLWLTRYGIRLVEAIILSLVLIVTGCFVVELWFAKPIFTAVASGLIPQLNDASLYVAIYRWRHQDAAQPHLHSALVQTRRIGDDGGKKIARRQLYRFVHRPERSFGRQRRHPDSSCSGLFQERNDRHRDSTGAPVVSSVTGDGLRQRSVCDRVAGQRPVVHAYEPTPARSSWKASTLRVRPRLRRLITRSSRLFAVVTVYNSGDEGTYRLLILSQVILSMQLPFAIIPLIRFTSDRSRMGEFANRTWVNVLAWTSAVLIIALNFRLAASAITPWVEAAPWRAWFVIPAVAGVVFLLGWVTFARPHPPPVPASP
jgi:manganese transport protein